jgi:hypothetical protein
MKRNLTGQLFYGKFSMGISHWLKFLNESNEKERIFNFFVKNNYFDRIFLKQLTST